MMVYLMVLLHKNVSDHILVYSVQWRKIEGILIFSTWMGVYISTEYC